MKKYLFIALALLIASCEKPILDSEDSVVNGSAVDTRANVILHMTQFEQTAFTRAATDITDLCTRLNVAIFDADGTKVKTVAQKDTDSDFGTVALTLSAGTYQLVVIAHCCDGSATITDDVWFDPDERSTTVSLVGDFVAGQDYFLVLLPGTQSSFQMVFADGEGHSTSKKASEGLRSRPARPASWK